VTRPEDARAAASLGAWAIGMILSRRGPRFLERERAAEVRAAIPPGVLAAGVFVDEDGATIEEAARALRLDLVQLHGSESPALLGGLSVPAIKAFPVGAAAPDLAPWSACWGALLEGAERGRPFDWKLARGLGAPGGRLLVAGALDATNAARAILAARPFALDVSSGVELRPGEKDPSKLEAFFAAVAGAKESP
jgi:phosphoribosylanthranilate isomerase